MFSSTAMNLPRPRWYELLGVAAFVVYTLAVLFHRGAGMLDEFSADPDQPQAVWQYWRYRIPGAIPPGNPLTDYAFSMHAPGAWWLMMATLSTFVQPLTAAKILFVVAWLGAVVAVVVGVGAKTRNVFIGLAAGLLLVRNADFTVLIAGGYARSFGPLLTIAFVGAFLNERHRLCLAILVVQSVLYPSTVIACGLAYGAYVVLAGPMRARLQRCAGMFVAGVVILLLARVHEGRVPKEWGPIVTYEESTKMVAWGPQGRQPDVPMSRPRGDFHRNVRRAFKADPPMLLSPAAAEKYRVVVPLTIAGAGLLVVAIDRVVRSVRRRRGAVVADAPADARFPWQLLVVLAGTIAGYFLARALAWRLYYPYRILTHNWPYLLYIALPLVAYTATRALLPARRGAATALAVLLAVAPVFVVSGPGFGATGRTYRSAAGAAGLWRAIRKLPLDSMIACDRPLCDVLSVYTARPVYANRALTHAYRKGYYELSERRLLAMLRAVYATRIEDVVQFARAEGVTHFAYSMRSFQEPDGRLFEPVRKQALRWFEAGKTAGFALANPPPSAVLHRKGRYVLVDVDKLAASIAP